MSAPTAANDADVPPPFRPWPEGAEIKTFKGGCHCRKFTFELEHPSLEVRPPLSCNCSICTQKAELHIYVPEARFHFTTGSFEELSKYEWGMKRLVRQFCPNCGCSILWTGAGLVGVNVRTFEGIQVDKLKLTYFDGAST